MSKKKIMDIFIGAVLFYLLLCGVLYFAQRSMIYFPDKTKPTLIDGAEGVHVTTDDGQTIESWFFKATDNDKPVLIYFHGNAGNYGDRYYKAAPYIQAGYGVLLAEYRGYGGNKGDISEQGIYNDARAQMTWLIQEKNIPLDRIVIYGESIGTGAAVQMANEFRAKALILEAPFSSLYEMAGRLYPMIPIQYLLKDKYMNIDKIASIHMPVLIIHGQKDATIPIVLAEKLFDSAVEPKEFIAFPQAGHNNLYNFGAYSRVISFLTGIGRDNDDNE
tara:strand:- start:20418 stop:21242 length:825 start_codon:yes stop_codon:yes gene_type:complete